MTYINLDEAIAKLEANRITQINSDADAAYDYSLNDALAALRALPTVSVGDADIERIAPQNAKEYLQGTGPWKLDEIGITADDYLVKCFAKAIREAALGATVSDGWQPIETAPRDGSTFLTYSPPALKDPNPDYDTAGFIVEKGEFWKAGCGFDWVTHWRPLPAPPTIEGE